MPGRDEIAAASPSCDHHWVSTHQPDFPDPIYWVGVCSFCGRIDGQMLADQLLAALPAPTSTDAARTVPWSQIDYEVAYHANATDSDPTETRDYTAIDRLTQVPYADRDQRWHEAMAAALPGEYLPPTASPDPAAGEA